MMHEMHAESRTDEGTLLACPQCDRKVIIKRGGAILIVERGDFHSMHHWSSFGALEITQKVGD